MDYVYRYANLLSCACGSIVDWESESGRDLRGTHVDRMVVQGSGGSIAKEFKWK